MKITLSLDINVINAILGLLGKCPYDQVVKTIDDIRAQVAEQTKEPPNA
jgi:hypothetical protein